MNEFFSVRENHVFGRRMHRLESVFFEGFDRDEIIGSVIQDGIDFYQVILVERIKITEGYSSYIVVEKV